MTFTCDNPACGASMEWDPRKGHVPTGWKFIPVMGEIRLWCEACRVHFDNQTSDNGPGDISPMMKDDLGIEE